ncbi:hypothetical protein [uncultured Clostridium sp.]|uniref:hypothetical protein n=1 Tax=uncultured Clostridium sp. TaxID=59620 RepID=UPI0025EBE4FC|nr:hypothetical protein [uncultured Clostridium sp.]
MVTFICIKYTIFYEQALLDDSLFDKDTTAGMMLLSHYFFKVCGFRTNIKLYMKDYCKVKGYDYETCIMKDRY